MNDFKGTPAPWYTLDKVVWTGDERLKDNDGYIVAECYGLSDAKHNAKLIASAPDLLEALQSLMEHYKKHGQILTWNVDIARQAINKALE